jgi:hypothetical protein
MTADERAALSRRLVEAERDLATKECSDVGERFRNAIRQSTAVICCNVSRALSLLQSDNLLYASFYELVSGGIRRPEETAVETDRLLADDLLFPHYREQIHFAALTLDGRGVHAYGACALLLKEGSIAHRATVFETNSVYFCRKHLLRIGSKIPPGHRAAWEMRDELALVKHKDDLTPDLGDEQFSQLLMRNADSDTHQDFIEVHIYGSLHRAAVQSVLCSQTQSVIDNLLANFLQQLAEQANIGWTTK